MSGLAPSLIGLLGQTPWEQMGGGFRGKNARFDAQEASAMALVIALVAVGIWVLARMTRGERIRSYSNPRRLFQSLCKAHGLDWSSRRLLMQVAAWQRLQQPARLFLEPERFHAANLGPAIGDQRDKLQRIHDRLFGAAASGVQEPLPTAASHAKQP